MSVEHILTEILNRPLFVTPDKLSVILGVLNKKSDNPLSVDLSDLLPALGSDVNGGAVQAEARSANASNEKKIGVVSALGSLVYRNGGNPGAGSGLRSYRDMQQQIQRCLDTNDIDGILMDFNSYGGSAQGCERFARFVKEADSQKPIYAVIDLNCFSAAYYAASACRKIILTDQDAGAGSIGCIAIHRDQSKRNEMEGDVFTAVFFGAEKNLFSSYEPLTKETMSKLQRSVDQFGMKFVSTVAEFRGMSEKAVIDTQAGVFYGQDAIDVGLADEIAGFDEAVAMLAAEIDDDQNKKYYGGSSMTTLERMQKLLSADDGLAAMAELGWVKKEAVTDAEKKGVEAAAEAVEVSQKETIDVAEICQLAQLSVDDTVTILKDGLTVAETKETVQKMRAKITQRTTVHSNLTPLTGSGKNSLIVAAEELAAAAK